MYFVLQHPRGAQDYVAIGSGAENGTTSTGAPCVHPCSREHSGVVRSLPHCPLLAKLWKARINSLLVRGANITKGKACERQLGPGATSLTHRAQFVQGSRKIDLFQRLSFPRGLSEQPFVHGQPVSDPAPISLTVTVRSNALFSFGQGERILVRCWKSRYTSERVGVITQCHESPPSHAVSYLSSFTIE